MADISGNLNDLYAAMTRIPQIGAIGGFGIPNLGNALNGAMSQMWDVNKNNAATQTAYSAMNQPIALENAKTQGRLALLNALMPVLGQLGGSSGSTIPQMTGFNATGPGGSQIASANTGGGGGSQSAPTDHLTPGTMGYVNGHGEMTPSEQHIALLRALAKNKSPYRTTQASGFRYDPNAPTHRPDGTPINY